MSITVHWRPKSKKSNHFNEGTSTSFERLITVFGSVITRADIPRLRAMQVAAKDSFYGEVAEMVESIGDIEVWGEH